MRLADALASLGPECRFEDTTSDRIDLRRYASSVAWTDNGEGSGPRYLVGLIDDIQAGEDLASLLDRVGGDSIVGAVILTGDDEIGFGVALLDLAAQRGFQVITAVPLDYDWLRAAVVVERTATARFPARFLAPSARPDLPLDDQGALLAINLLQLETLRSRILQQRLTETAVESRGMAERLAANQVQRVSAEARRRLAAETAVRQKTIESLEDQLERTKARAERAEANVARARQRWERARQSSGYLLAQALTQAARNPFPDLFKLPVRAARLYRRSGSSANPPPEPVTEQALPKAEVTIDVAPEPFLSADGLVALWAHDHARLAYPPADTDRRAVATVTHPMNALRVGDRWLVLSPNDALAALERSLPELVVIDASAALAGSAWTAMGSPAGLRRDQILHALVERAGSYGIATVFRWDVARHLAPHARFLAERCDAVVGQEIGHGVNLRRFNPLGRAPSGQPACALILPRPSGEGGRPPDLEGVRAMLEGAGMTLGRLGQEVLADPDRFANELGAADLAIVTGRTGIESREALEALASGVTVFGRASQGFPEVGPIDELDAAAIVDRHGRSAGFLPRHLRHLYLNRSLLAEEGQLRRVAGLADTPPQVIALVQPSAGLEAQLRLVASQSLGPSSAVVLLPEEADGAAGGALRWLTSNGIEASAISTPAELPGEWFRDAPTTYLWPLADPAAEEPDLLVDLMVGAEMSGLAVCGWSGTGPAPGYDFASPNGAFIVRAGSVMPREGESLLSWADRVGSSGSNHPALALVGR